MKMENCCSNEPSRILRGIRTPENIVIVSRTNWLLLFCLNSLLLKQLDSLHVHSYFWPKVPSNRTELCTFSYLFSVGQDSLYSMRRSLGFLKDFINYWSISHYLIQKLVSRDELENPKIQTVILASGLMVCIIFCCQFF